MASIPDRGAVALKSCIRCGETKPVSEFYARSDRVNQYLSRCKVCHNAVKIEQFKAKYAVDPEPFKAAVRAAYAADPEKHRARVKAWRDANPEKVREQERAYKAAHPEKVKAKKDGYRRRRAHVIAAWNQADYAANREAYLAYRKAWRDANPETFRAISIRAKHRRRSNEAAAANDLTADQWREIVESQDGRCLKCDRPFTEDLPPTRDHVVPVSKGGGLTRSNVVALCKPCNSSKGDKIVDYRSPRPDQLSLF